jgi:hypothetical protein
VHVLVNGVRLFFDVEGCHADVAAALPAHLVRFERFPNCGHAVVPDAPERAMVTIRGFIERQ